MNTKELTAFPGEQEVILQDGITFKVIKVYKTEEKNKFRGTKKNITVVELEPEEDEFSTMSSFRRIFFKLLTQWNVQN